MHLKPVAFEYVAAGDVAAATSLLADADSAKPIAGGQSLGPMLNLRLARPTALVDVSRAADMRSSRDEG
jgi:carbon-monoxide dehydrogenase medium subunit